MKQNDIPMNAVAKVLPNPSCKVFSSPSILSSFSQWILSTCLIGIFVIAGAMTNVYSQTDKVIYSTNFGGAAGAVSTIPGWTTSGTSPGNLALSLGSTSTGYSSPISASGSANLAYTDIGMGTSVATLSGQINTQGLSDIKVIYAARRTSYSGTVTFEWSSDGSTWTPVSYTDVANNATWGVINGGTWINLSGAEGHSNLQFRFTFPGNATNPGNYRIEDFTILGTCSSSFEATFAGGGEVCTETDKLLTATVTAGGITPFTLSLNNGGGSTTSSNPVSILVSPTSNTTYTAIVTDSRGCIATVTGETQSVTVNSIPSTPTTVNPSSACFGSAVVVEGTGSIQSQGGVTGYTFWNAETGGSQLGATNVLGTISGNVLTTSTSLSAGTHDLYIQAEGVPPSCPSARKKVTITILPLPTITGVAQLATVCNGSSATINLTGLPSNSVLTVNYTIDGVAQTPVTVTSSGTNGSFSRTLNDVDHGKILEITSISNTSQTPNCSNTFTGISTALAVNPLPTVTATGGAFNRNQTPTITATTGFASYVWSGTPSVTGTGNSVTISPTPAAGTYSYSVLVTDANTCQNTANATVIIYDAELYVNSTTGSDANSGTLASPLATIQKAVDVAVAGDVINVAAGTYTENITISGKNGLVIKGPYTRLNDANGTRLAEASIVAASNAPVITVGSTVTSYTIDGFRLVGADYLNDVNGSIIFAVGNATVSNILNNILEISSNADYAKRYIWLGQTGGSNSSGSDYISGGISHNSFTALGSGKGFAGITMQKWSKNFNINGNRFAGMTGHRNILIYHPTATVVISNNDFSCANDGSNGGSARELISVQGIAPTDVAGGLVIQNNTFSIPGKAISTSSAVTYGANITITNNDFGSVSGLAIQNGGSGTIAATCNWYGTATAGLIPAKISGSANYTPWLIGSGDGAAVGFQPTASCTGTPIAIASATATNIYCGPTTGSVLVTFSGGTGPYDIAWTGGSATGITSPYSITPLLAGAYTITITDANGSMATSSATIQYLPVTNTTQTTYYATIQAAINAANNSDMITVCAGTYTENIMINGKNGLVIKGPNSTLNDANGTRATEAIIVAASNTELITVDANVTSYTINGFKLVGADYLSGSNGRMIWSKGIGTVSNILNNVFELTSNDGTTAKRYIWLGPASAGASGSTFISGSISYNTFNGLGTGTEYQAIIMQQWAQNFNINANKLTGIKGTAEASILVWNPSPTVQITNNELNNTAANGVGVYLLGAVPTVLGAGGGVVQNNKFGSSARGVAFFTFPGASFVSNVTNNDFEFTTLGVWVQPASNVAITGTCNWWGTASANSIPAKISVSSPASINYTPWLISGGDGAAFGFQPTATCTGTPVVIASAVPTHIYCGPTTGSVLVSHALNS